MKPLPGMRKRGKKWYGRFPNAQGIEIERPLSATLSHARTIFIELKHRVELEKAGLAPMAAQRTLLTDITSNYVEYLRGRVSRGEITDDHREHVERDVARVIALTKEKTVAKLTAPEFKKMRSKLVEDGASHRTANKMMGYLKSALTHAASEGVIPANPVAAVKKLPEGGVHKARNRTRLTVEQCNDLVAACRVFDGRFPNRVPQAPLVCMMLDTGFRLSEATLIEWRDLSIKPNGIPIIHVRPEVAKTGEERHNEAGGYICAEDFKALKRQHAKVTGRVPGPNDRILLTPRGKQWKARSNLRTSLRWFDQRLCDIGIAEKLGPDKVDKLQPDGTTPDWYSLRHAYCTHCFEAGIPVERVSIMMGHSDISTTWKYYTDWKRIATDEASSKLRQFRNKTRRDSNRSKHK